MKVKKGRILSPKEKKLNRFDIKYNLKKIMPLQKKIINRNRIFFKTNLKIFHEKKYLVFCLKKVKLFLSQKGYISPFFSKIPFSMKNRDFFQIIFFLFKKIDKNFKVRNKPENEIPIILRYLGYPFSLSKSILYFSINPRNISFYLSCLNWIVELCLYDTKAIYEDELVFSKKINKTLIWNRMVWDYKKFLTKKIVNYKFTKIVKLILINNLNKKKKSKNLKIKISEKFKKFTFFIKIILFIFEFFRRRKKIIGIFKEKYINSLIFLENDYSKMLKKFEKECEKFLMKKLQNFKKTNLIKKNSRFCETKQKIKELIVADYLSFFLPFYNRINQNKKYFGKLKFINSKIFNFFFEDLYKEKKNLNLKFFNHIKNYRFFSFFWKEIFSNSKNYFFLFEEKIFLNFRKIFDCTLAHIFRASFYIEFLMIHNQSYDFISNTTCYNTNHFYENHKKIKVEKFEKYNENGLLYKNNLNKKRIKKTYSIIKNIYGFLKLKNFFFLVNVKNFLTNFLNYLKLSFFLIISIFKKEKLLLYLL